MNERIPQGMYDAFWDEDGKGGPSRMRAALLWLADIVDANNNLVTQSKLAAVSAYLATGRQAAVEPVRLMKAIAAALRQAAGGEG